jgi:hypothetical protein
MPRKHIKEEIRRLRLRLLKRLVQERFDGSISEFAKAIDRQHGYVWQIYNEQRPIGEDIARHIEQALHLESFAMDRDLSKSCRLEWVFTPNPATSPIIYRAVPVYGWNQMDEYLSGKETAPEDYRICGVPCSDKTYAIESDDDSNEPRIRKGEMMYFDPEKVALRDGAIYLVTRRAWAHARPLLCESSGGAFTLRPCNPSYASAWPRESYAKGVHTIRAECVYLGRVP